MHPTKIQAHIPDLECHTVPEAGFAGKKNGSLLDAAESAGFDIFVTMDKGLEYQQHLAGRSLRFCSSVPNRAARGPY
jgi:hypothetical protein